MQTIALIVLSQSCPALCGHGLQPEQVPLSTEFSRQEHWNGLQFPTPGDLSNPGMEPMSLASPALQADSLPPAERGSP